MGKYTYRTRKRWPNSFEIRFEGYETPCWIWTGYLYPVTGYGRWQRQGAHRVMFRIANGWLPGKGYHIDHLCRNRACVNPRHLEAVTFSENMRRGKRTKLNAQKVQEIKTLRASGKSLKEVAALFDLRIETVSRVALGQSTWQ